MVTIILFIAALLIIIICLVVLAKDVAGPGKDILGDKLESLNKDLAQGAKKIAGTSQPLISAVKKIVAGVDKFIEEQDYLAPEFREKGKKFFSNAKTVIEGIDETINEPLKILLGTVSQTSSELYGQTAKDYRYIISEDSDHPFQVNKLVAETAKKITEGKNSDREKAEAIHDWFLANIKYGKDKVSKHKGEYRTSLEVFTDQEGVCGEMAVLYVVMARAVGLKANYASVQVDYENEDVNHACAAVKLNKQILVDPAYRKFDIKHKKFKILSDQEAVPHFKAMRGSN